MPILRHTRQQAAVLKAITEGHSDCGLPPYNIADIDYMLGSSGLGKEQRVYEHYGLKKPMPIRSVHRILNALHAEGVITYEYRVTERTENKLPQRQRHWHVAGKEIYNTLQEELSKLLYQAKTVHGCTDNFFGHASEEPSASETDILALVYSLSSFLERSHPDKAPGCDDLFAQATDALNGVRAVKKEDCTEPQLSGA